jgi:hypothetical protein
LVRIGSTDAAYQRKAHQRAFLVGTGAIDSLTNLKAQTPTSPFARIFPIQMLTLLAVSNCPTGAASFAENNFFLETSYVLFRIQLLRSHDNARLICRDA